MIMNRSFNFFRVPGCCTVSSAPPGHQGSALDPEKIGTAEAVEVVVVTVVSHRMCVLSPLVVFAAIKIIQICIYGWMDRQTDR